MQFIRTSTLVVLLVPATGGCGGDRLTDQDAGGFDAGVRDAGSIGEADVSSDALRPDGEISDALSDAPTPISPLTFCDVYGVAWCDAHLRCCSTPADSREECLTEFVVACQELIQPLIATPRTGYDGHVAREVVEEGIVLGETCDLGIQDWVWSHDGLLRMFRGTLGSGQDCSEGLIDFAGLVSCQGNLQCRRAGILGANRRCGPASIENEVCRDFLDCDELLRCTRDRVINRCVPRLEEGESCVAARDCLSLICEGTCQPLTTDAVYCVEFPLFEVPEEEDETPSE